MKAIAIEKLTKEYKGGVRALDSLSLQVECGEIFSLLGPNGAGKSTLINTLTTYQTPTSGHGEVLGKDLVRDAAFVRSQVACVAQKVSIDNYFSLRQNMLFQSRLYKVDKREAAKRIDELIRSFGLEEYEKRPVITYSGGVKRRLDIAMTMVSRPKILFLDEPTVGMDIASRRAMWDMMLKIRNDYGTTIFLTTHYLEEADQLSDTVCIMKQGHELAQGTPGGLRQYLGRNLIRIGFEHREAAVACADVLNSSSIVQCATAEEQAVLATVEDSADALRTLSGWLLAQGQPFTSVGIVQPSLEDVFFSMTNGQNGGRSA